MMKRVIIPAIIAADLREFKHKISIVTPHVSLVQLDVMDGVFTDAKSWPYHDENVSDIDAISQLDASVRFDVHLMIQNPEMLAGEWASQKHVDRVFVHFESTAHLQSAITEVSHAGARVGIVLKYETPPEVLVEYADKIDTVQLMGIARIGAYGRPLEEGIFPKIRRTRELFANLPICIDGGVTHENAALLFEAGADALVVGSAIFNASDPIAALTRFQKTAGSGNFALRTSH